MARPTKFKPEFVALARKAAQLGATDIEIADMLNVHLATLYRWKAEHKALAEALKVGKSVADDRVERALFTRATGFEHDDVDIRVVDGSVRKTKVRKHYPPDTAAAIFWLKNRRRDKWREKVDLEHVGRDGGPIESVSRIELVPMTK